MKFEAKITAIIKRTYNIKSFRFDKPASFKHKPGQFMYITLQKDNQTMAKHFTISSSPTEDYLEFTKKLTGHPFSNALDALKEGDSLEINGPFGFFTFEGESEKAGMLTGGIGITPIRSMCRFCTDKKKEANIILLYGNRTPQDIAFKQEFEDMEEENKNFKVIFTLSQPDQSWAGRKGRIKADMVRQEIPDYKERVFFICGPLGMVTALNELLIDLGLPENQIKKEDFPGY